MKFKSSKFTHILSDSQPAKRPSSATATALEYLNNKDNHIRFIQNCCSKECLSTVPWCFLLYFISSLSSSNYLQ